MVRPSGPFHFCGRLNIFLRILEICARWSSLAPLRRSVFGIVAAKIGGAGGMKIRQGFLATVPTRALVIFALGIFFLFSTIGIASDMTQMGRQPVARYLLITLVISVFAI